LAAQVTIKAVNGGLDIEVENLATGVIKKGQAVSALSFELNGLAAPTALTEIVGHKVSSADFTPGKSFPGSATVTPVDDHGSSMVIDHWGLSVGPTDFLATAGTGSPGHKPQFMILPSSGIVGNGQSLIGNGGFDPYFIGPIDFFVSVPGVTSSTVLALANFSNFQVGFGTNVDKFLGTVGHKTVDPMSVPEPSSMILSLISIAGLVYVRRRSRRK